MAVYLKKFNTTQEHTNYTRSAQYVEPYASVVDDGTDIETSDIYYNQYNYNSHIITYDKNSNELTWGYGNPDGVGKSGFNTNYQNVKCQYLACTERPKKLKVINSTSFKVGLACYDSSTICRAKGFYASSASGYSTTAVYNLTSSNWPDSIVKFFIFIWDKPGLTWPKNNNWSVQLIY